jgi:hypothetical protein
MKAGLAAADLPTAILRLLEATQKTATITSLLQPEGRFFYTWLIPMGDCSVMKTCYAAAAVLLTSAATLSPTFAAEAPRGQLLYENHCRACHSSTAHIRSDRKVQSRQDLEAQIRRWAGQLQLPWNDEDVASVLRFLDDRYYHLP